MGFEDGKKKNDGPEISRRAFLGEALAAGAAIAAGNAIFNPSQGPMIESYHIQGIERFEALLTKGKSDQPMTDEEQQEFSRIRRALRDESNRVMQSLSDMLPEEKRARQEQ